jgi:hypothetical protein
LIQGLLGTNGHTYEKKAPSSTNKVELKTLSTQQQAKPIEIKHDEAKEKAMDVKNSKNKDQKEDVKQPPAVHKVASDKEKVQDDDK